MKKQWRGTQRQNGFIAYVFVVIAMLSMVAAAVAAMSRSGGRQQWNFETKNALMDASKIIRSRVIFCGIAFPAGDNGSGFHTRFPATPGTGNVTDLVCPGQPAPNNLWTGKGGLPLPTQPGGFAPWQYVNDGTSVRISLRATGGTTDIAAIAVLDSLALRIGTNASRTADILTIILMA